MLITGCTLVAREVVILWLVNNILQANIGAKNFTVIMPDANVDATLNALVAAGFGAAGQRCTAISTVIFVGGSELWYYAWLLVFVDPSISLY